MDGEATALPTTLERLHQQKGARLGVWFGCTLPDRFGDWQTEYHFLRATVGLLDNDYRTYLEFAGADRVRYLNAILTNDIKGLKQNHGSVSLFLDPQGHIQAEIETYALFERLFCVSYARIRQRLLLGLDKYIIMDEVTLTDQTERFSTCALEGPRTEEIVRRLAGIELGAMEELEMAEGNVGGIPCVVMKRSPGGTVSAEFLVGRSETEVLWQTLEKETQKVAGGPVGYLALNALRLEQGIPWFGYDFGEKQIPHEAGLEHSHISYTKGCYIGQEIVERVRSRGQVNRVRVSLRLAAETPVKANALLRSEGKDVGYVTRTGFSPKRNAEIGMGYVRREKMAVGTRLEVDGGTAEVIAPEAW